MTQTNYTLITGQPFPQFAGKLSLNIDALRTWNSGSNFPTTFKAFDKYIDSNNGNFYIRNSNNTNWILHGNVNVPNFGIETSIVSDSTLSGEGTSSNPLRVTNPFTDLDKNSISFNERRIGYLEDGEIAIRKSPNTIIWSNPTSTIAGFRITGAPIGEAQLDTTTGWITEQTSGISNGNGLIFTVRISKESSPSSYRLLFRSPENYHIVSRLLSHMTQRIERNYINDYYQFTFPYNVAIGNIILQTTNSNTHIHQTVWLGGIDRFGIDQILTQENIFPSLEETIDGITPVTVNRDTSRKLIRIGLDGFNTEYWLNRVLPTRTTEDRGKLLSISKTDNNVISLVNSDALDIGLPQSPTQEGKYELDVNSRGDSSWIEASSGSGSSATGLVENYATIAKNATEAASTQTILTESQGFDRNTIYTINIIDNNDKVEGSVTDRGSNLSLGREIKSIVDDFRIYEFGIANNTDLTLRIRAGSAVGYTVIIRWLSGDPNPGIATVATDSTITGDGTSSNPLKVSKPVNDKNILDLAEHTRIIADRGRFLGISETNENKLALFDAPSDGEDTEHLLDLTNDIDLIDDTIEYEIAPADEMQWTGFSLSSGIATRLNSGIKITDGDKTLLTTSTWLTNATISGERAIVIRIKPSITNIANYGISIGNIEADSHQTHTFRMIGSDRNWSYFFVRNILPDNPGDNIGARKRVTNYTTAYHGDVNGPLRDRVNELSLSVVDIEAVVDDSSRTLATSARGGWTEFGSDSRLYSESPRNITLTQSELNVLSDVDTIWSQEGAQSHQTATIVRLNRLNANPNNYVFVSGTEGSVRLWSHNYVGQDSNWNYYIPHKNTSLRGESAKIEVIDESYHTVYHGKLGEEALNSVIGKPYGQLYWNYADGTLNPISYLRTDFIDELFGENISGSSAIQNIRLLVKGRIPGLTSSAQLKNINCGGFVVRTSFTLTQGEYVGGHIFGSSGIENTGDFSLFIPLTGDQLDTIKDNFRGQALRVDITYDVGDGNKRYRLTIPWLSQSQENSNPLTPYIPSTLIIGGGRRVRLGSRSWTMQNSQNIIYQNTGIVIPAMQDDDLLRISVAHPLFDTKASAGFMWEFIKNIPAGTVGANASFQNSFSFADTTDSNDPNPKCLFSLTNTRRLLVAFFVGGGQPAGGSVKVTAWKE